MAKEKHETTLLNLKNFCGLKCKVTPHSSLNISKGIVRCPALNRQTCEHILEFMGEQGVTDVRRISVFHDGAKKPTNTFVFTFNSPVLPSVVKIGFMQSKKWCKDQESIQSSTTPDPGYQWESDKLTEDTTNESQEVSPFLVKNHVYIQNPLRCYQCQLFGHHEKKCGRQAICVNCSMPKHCPVGRCQRPAKCVNCSGEHPANSKQCPAWEKEKKILKIKCEQNISFPEARKQYEQFYDTRSYASAVKPGTCNKSTQTDNKSTQTDDSFTEYLKNKNNHHQKNTKRNT